MSNYKKLVNNSLIFAVGNLGNKLIVFFLLPIHTYALTTSEFGRVDLLTTTISLLFPIFTLSIFDSVLRFSMDKNYDKQAVLSNSLVVSLIGFVFLLLIYPVFVYFFPFGDIIFYFYLLIFVQSLSTILTQYARAIGLIRLFAISGIVNAFVVLVCNLLLLMVFDLGVIGYIISLIIAHLICIVYVMISGKIQKDFTVNKINIKLTKEMLLYCTPLIPNALMWWIMGLSDRYIISYFLGLSANGMYAVANKIPSILNIINSIFFQAWQMSAIEEVDSKDKSAFFSNVFNVFSIVMLLSTSILLVFLKPIMVFFVTDSYYEAWKFIPFLLLGVVFSSFSAFLGTNYIASKKTGGVFKTSLLGAIINIIANIILVPIIGLNGASIGTMISFFIIWILRIRDTKGFVSIRLNVNKLVLTLIALMIQIRLLYMDLTFEYIFQMLVVFIIILINHKEMKLLIEKIKGVLLKKLKPTN